jgi:hypothetical protein
LTLRTGLEGPVAKKRQSSTLSLTLAVDVGGWLPCPGRFTTGERNLVPIAGFVSDASEQGIYAMNLEPVCYVKYQFNFYQTARCQITDYSNVYDS